MVKTSFFKLFSFNNNNTIKCGSKFMFCMRNTFYVFQFFPFPTAKFYLQTQYTTTKQFTVNALNN